MEKQNDSLKHLFQQEFAKMVAVISKQFGLEHIEMAEDIVSETFLAASESWGIKGLPPNPAAWLYTVAKQKTLYHFRRNRIFDEKVLPELALHQEENEALNFSEGNIKDSQLRMMFAVCNPVIASEAQIGLALRILCGFGIDEIAEAFLTNKETINKRLFRAKEKLRTEHVEMEFPASSGIASRLDNVLHVIYLLFNEGYYSKTQNQILQKDVCYEAMRLCVLLTEYPETDRPQTNALLALMCFHASRFAARETQNETLVLYEQQNEALWDQALIDKGIYYLNRSAHGDEVSAYHLEARIAHWHCIRADSTEKWQDILGLYDQLLKINYSSSAALSRIFALFKVSGREPALAEAKKLALEDNHFYFMLLGELYTGFDSQQATVNFQHALRLAKTETEKRTIRKKIDAL